jgi:hypothetical protein
MVTFVMSYTLLFIGVKKRVVPRTCNGEETGLESWKRGSDKPASQYQPHQFCLWTRHRPVPYNVKDIMLSEPIFQDLALLPLFVTYEKVGER